MLSFIVVNSRSDIHPDWVNTCLDSVNNQVEPIELIVIDNIGRVETIGKCFNEGVLKSSNDWVCFVGDDDWVAPDYSRTLSLFIKENLERVVNIATYMTAFNEDGQKTALPRQSTGAWNRSYLLKYPFNEKLEKGIDREYIEETVKRGDLCLIIEYYFGYFYRKHNDYSCAGTITFTKEKADYYFVAPNKNFLSPITDRFSKDNNVFIDNNFNYELAESAKVIWCEFANNLAIEVANYKTSAKKILRLHAYEAFSDSVKYIDFNKFDAVIFIADHIKNYVEKQYGKIKNAVVIPNGVDLNKFSLHNTAQNNKIAYAGYLTRKKGIGEILLLAKHFPEYEFYLAGKYQEDDVAEYLNNNKPDNVFIENWQYDINSWFQDKSYILNLSLRESQAMSVMEGMACGLKPLIYNWIGASDIYPETFNSINEFETLLKSEYEPLKYRKFIEDNYNFDSIYSKIEELINADITAVS